MAVSASLLASLSEHLGDSTFSRDLVPEQTLYRRGDDATDVFFVEYGRLRLFSFDAEGRSVPLYVVRAQEFVSEAALFAEAYCSDVVAEVRTRVRCFPKGRLLQALHDSPQLAEHYMAAMARRINALRVRLELRNVRSARERVLQYLLTSAPVGSETVPMDRPLKSVADDLGLTPESFYRALAALAAEGHVSRKKRMIVLHRVRRPRNQTVTSGTLDTASSDLGTA